MWKTCIVTINTNGSDPYVLLDYDMASHYCWKDSENIMIYANGELGHQLYIYKDKTKEYEVLDIEFFVQDGHCSYSPDQKWLLYDSYPDKENYRHLYLYNIEKHKGVTLGSYYSYPNITGDIRCDLHPRWNRTGDMISFDSIHEGKRDIYYINLDDCKHLF